MMGLDAMILFFWILSFKPAFSLSSFILIKRLSIFLIEWLYPKMFISLGDFFNARLQD